CPGAGHSGLARLAKLGSERPMSTWKTLAAHVITAAVTLALVLVLFGGRLGARRPAPVAQIPGGPRASRELRTQAPQAQAAPYQLPAVAPPSIPADVLKGVDADEKSNIH